MVSILAEEQRRLAGRLGEASGHAEAAPPPESEPEPEIRR
jgi:hypothetical protein